jgi:hypothetical protein
MGQFLPATTGGACRRLQSDNVPLKMMNQARLVLDLSAKGDVVWRGVAQTESRLRGY